MKTHFNLKSMLCGMLLIALLIPNFSSAQEKKYEKETETIFQSIKTKNYGLIKPLLDSHVLINSSIPKGMNDAVVPQVLAQIEVPTSYSILKTEAFGDNVKVFTEFAYPNKKVARSFVFNAFGKVVELDILSDAKKVEAQIGFPK